MYKLYLIISAQRHGSTTFCSEIHNNKYANCYFELLNNRRDLRSKELLFPFLDEKLLDSNVCFKIFYDHCNLVLLQELIQNYNPVVIFLERNLANAYVSYVHAMTTGNWNTNKSTNDKITHAYINEKAILPFHTYISKISLFFVETKRICQELNVCYHNLSFEEDIVNSYRLKTKLKEVFTA